MNTCKSCGKEKDHYKHDYCSECYKKRTKEYLNFCKQLGEINEDTSSST